MLNALENTVGSTNSVGPGFSLSRPGFKLVGRAGPAFQLSLSFWLDYTVNTLENCSFT